MFLYSRLRKRIPGFSLELLKKLHLAVARSNPEIELEKWKDDFKDIHSKIDLFMAPSSFVKNIFIEYGFPAEKILYSPYGFDLHHVASVPKSKSKVLRFGFMGTLLPVKGVSLLISAFKGIKNKNIRLSIYGKLFPYAGFDYYPNLLKKMVKGDARIELMGGYDNKDSGRILANIDVLVVPSLWLENAPLVIQEAFLAKTPVIASRIGGIPELINDGVNGLLFKPGDADDLRGKMQSIIDNPRVIEEFQKNMPGVRSIEDDARQIEEIYKKLILGKEPSAIYV